MQEYLTNITLIGGAITAISVIFGVVYKFVISPAKKLIATVSSISKEFFPNGGSSMRDCLDRLHQEIKTISATQKAMCHFSELGFFEADEHGKCIFVNKRWTEMTGMALDSALGNGWVSSIHENHRARVFDEWESAIEQERDLSIIYKTKNKITVNFQMILIKSNAGKITGMIGALSPTNEEGG